MAPWTTRFNGFWTKAVLGGILAAFSAGLPGAGAVATSQGPDPIKIAVIMAATGLAADTDLAAIDAARLAVDEINRRGGVGGRPVTMLLLDNHSSPLHAKQAAEKAVSLGVAGVIGAVWSSHSQVLAPVLQGAKIPMITPASTHPDITRAGDFIFRICPVNSVQGRIMADFAFHDLGIRRAAVVRNVNESYSMTLADHFVSNFEKFGGTVVLQEKYKGMAAGFRDILEQIRFLEPEAVLVPGYPRDSGLLIRQAVNMGIRTTFLGGDAWQSDVFGYGKDAMEGSYFTNIWNPLARGPAIEGFKRRYMEKTGRQGIGPQTALTYDAVMLMADAVSRAKAARPEKIRDALARTQSFRGVSGTIVFDAHGDRVPEVMPILACRQGRVVFVKNVRVWPGGRP